MMRMMKRWQIWVVSAALVLCVVVLSAFNDKDFKIAKNLDIFYTLFREVSLYYVDDTDPEKLITAGIEGMLEELDPYTSFIPEEEADDYSFAITGKYGGIGALIRKSGDYTVVAEPYEGFPAAKAGLRAGDKLLAIDGKSMKGKEVKEVSESLKGDPATELIVEIERPGTKEPLTIKIIREKISISNVQYHGMLNSKTGYIRLGNFTQEAGREVRNALLDLRNNKGAQNIILDLRGNPGGLLSEAVNIVGLFVPKGTEVVSTKGKIKQYDNVSYTQSEPVDVNIPLAVLVSRGSASASEIVAGALQDLDRAIIIGQRTFGKGLVQTTRQLSYNSQLKITMAKYYIPSGRCIQALDYSNRNDDGSVGHIPDSLISEFKTKNGRKVYDGGGIVPDIKTEAETISNISVSLYTKNHIFDFATKYCQGRNTIAPADSFYLTDEDYTAFVDFLKDKEYDYKSATDEKFKELVETAKKERYFDPASAEFQALEAKIGHDKEKDLITFKDEIKELLEEEIAMRYYFQKGRVKSSLRLDKEVKEAVKAINDTELYTATLTSKSPEERVIAKKTVKE